MWCVGISTKLSQISPSTWSLTWQRLVQPCQQMVCLLCSSKNGRRVIINTAASHKVLNELMVFDSVVTAVGEGSPQYAADPVTNHLQPSVSHGPEWDSSQTLQHGGAEDNREICPGEFKHQHLNLCSAALC